MCIVGSEIKKKNIYSIINVFEMVYFMSLSTSGII